MELFIGLSTVLYIFCAFAGMYLVNALFGMGMNCIINGEKFVWQKLFVSVMKILMSAVAMVAVVVTFNLLAKGANSLGVDVYDTVIKVISVGTYILLFVKGFTTTAIDVYNKIRDMFEIKDTTAFNTESVAGLSYKAAVKTYGEPPKDIPEAPVTHGLEEAVLMGGRG